MSQTGRFFFRGLWVFCALCLLASLVSAAPSRQLTQDALSDIQGGASDPLCVFTLVQFDCITTKNCASINPAAGCANGVCNTGNGVDHCKSQTSNWYKNFAGTTHKTITGTSSYACGMKCIGGNSYCAMWTKDKCGCYGTCTAGPDPCTISEDSKDLCQ